MSKKKFNYIFIAIVIGAVAIANGFIFAYSTYHSPTATPPGNNADVPLNEGGNPQIKNGDLAINGKLTANGGLVSTAPFSVPNNVATIGYNSGSSGGVFITSDGSPYGIASVQGVNSGFAPSSLAINPVGGNVGINTTSPSAQLEVNGDIKADSGIILGGVRKTSWPSSTSGVDKIQVSSKSTTCGTWDGQTPVANSFRGFQWSGRHSNGNIDRLERWYGSIQSGDNYICRALWDRVENNWVCHSLEKVGSGNSGECF